MRQPVADKPHLMVRQGELIIVIDGRMTAGIYPAPPISRVIKEVWSHLFKCHERVTLAHG